MVTFLGIIFDRSLLNIGEEGEIRTRVCGSET